MDQKFISMVKDTAIDDAIKWLPEYARDAKCEMGGRGLGVFLGAAAALQRETESLAGNQYGPYAQSSASGNANLALYTANA